MIDRTALLAALATITTARRDALTDSDAARAGMLATSEPASNQEMPQTLGALVRQLDNAARELADAIRSIDQKDRITAKAIG